MTDPYGFTRSLDAIMGAFSVSHTTAAHSQDSATNPGPDYAAEARNALFLASGVLGHVAIEALNDAILVIEDNCGPADATAATLRAMRAGLEGEKG